MKMGPYRETLLENTPREDVVTFVKPGPYREIIL